MSHSHQMLILDKRIDVDFIVNNKNVYQGCHLVSLTAEASQCLEEEGLDYTPIFKLVDASRLSQWDESINRDAYRTLQNLEEMLLQQIPSLSNDRGFLTGQAYYFQYVLSMVVTRFYLIDEAIRVLGATHVTVLDDGVDGWLDSTVESHNPWWNLLKPMLFKKGISVEFVSPIQTKSISFSTRFRRVISFVTRQIKNTIKSFMQLRQIPYKFFSSFNTTSLLFVNNATEYDWKPICQALLEKQPGPHVYVLPGNLIEARPWMTSFLPEIQNINGWSGGYLDIRLDVLNDHDIQSIRVTGDAHKIKMPPLQYFEVDLYPVLHPYLIQLACDSLALSRRSIQIAEAALTASRATAVCFSSIVDLASVRLAETARRKGIPVMCYQHGGSYGTHNNAQQDLTEFAYADYFLSYGSGIHPRSNPVLPTRAKIIPVGSARIQQKISRNHSHPKIGFPIKILWISEVSYRNALGGTFLMDDTRRYALECQALTALANIPNVQVTYRPFPGQEAWNGTSQWLSGKQFPRIRSNSISKIDSLYASHDLILIATASNTTWNEVMALQKPLLIFADSQHTLLQALFENDLRKLGCWYDSEKSFFEALHRFAEDPYVFIHQLIKQKSYETYLERYVLHEKGDITSRVTKFLEDVMTQHLWDGSVS